MARSPVQMKRKRLFRISEAGNESASNECTLTVYVLLKDQCEFVLALFLLLLLEFAVIM